MDWPGGLRGGGRQGLRPDALHDGRPDFLVPCFLAGNAMRAARPVVDILPALTAILSTVRTFEQPVAGPKRKREHLRLATAAARYPFRRRLMRRHCHVGPHAPDQPSMKAAPPRLKIGGERASRHLALHCRILPSTQQCSARCSPRSPCKSLSSTVFSEDSTPRAYRDEAQVLRRRDPASARIVSSDNGPERGPLKSPR